MNIFKAFVLFCMFGFVASYLSTANAACAGGHYSGGCYNRNTGEYWTYRNYYSQSPVNYRQKCRWFRVGDNMTSKICHGNKYYNR